MESKEPLDVRLDHAIGFVRVWKNIADKNKKIELDKDNLQIIYDLLAECKEKIINKRTLLSTSNH